MSFLKNKKTIFRYLLGPMLLLVFIELVLWKGSFDISGLFERLDQNARDLLSQRVINRAGYLQKDMIYSWSNLDGLAEQINEKAQKMEEEGLIDFETLDESSENATPLLLEILDPMIRTMRTSRVTGIYVVFNDEDLDLGLKNKTGIYIRDADPLSKSSSENGDLLLERAPIQVVEESNISTDSIWRPRFEFEKRQEEYYEFLYVPYQTAYHNTSGYTAEEMGYWGKAFSLSESNTSAITYSLPLINQAGRVYGVVGIDITLNYLYKLLPASELFENDSPASYLLAVMEEGGQTLDPVLARGNAISSLSEQLQLIGQGEDYLIRIEDENYYTALSYLDLYVSNTPYSHQKWVLAGVVNEANLYYFSTGMKATLRIAIAVLLLLGVAFSLWGSYLISKPVRVLSDQVDAAVPGQELMLSRTNILEIDKLEQKIEILDRSIRNTAMKFTNILKISSIEMAGYEYNSLTRELFLSDNYFSVFRDCEGNPDQMTLEDFLEKQKEYDACLISSDKDCGEYLYKIPDGNDSIYVRLRTVINGEVHTGVAENVTETIMEKKQIEYERDHDALTGILNRRAFLRRANLLLENKKKEQEIGALLMIDLDNLKYINDTFGHDYGDRYIRKAAETFGTCPSNHTMVARISGDEFNLLFYGYREKAQLQKAIDKLRSEIAKAFIVLPDQRIYPLHASGGYAWFPKDSDSLEQLQQYADYAMYQIKHCEKGKIKEFVREEFERDSKLAEGKKELEEILSEGRIQFYFQPIVDCRTAEIFAYEALMRSGSLTLKNPEEILDVARDIGRLGAVEELTWFGAMKAYARQVREGIIPDDCRVFINSMSGQRLVDEEIQKLEDKYPDLLQNVVMEITEKEPMNEVYLGEKKAVMKRWKAAVALDDYGSGYNGGKALLLAEPGYIKLDMAIVQNMDKDPDKCRMIESILGYAHQQNQKVVAEGIETVGELKQAILLGVDFVQGYLLAKPQPVPPGIDPEMTRLILRLNQEQLNP